jgi:hypothetical protein
MSSGTQQIRLIVMEFGRFTLGLGAGLALLTIMHQPERKPSENRSSAGWNNKVGDTNVTLRDQDD